MRNSKARKQVHVIQAIKHHGGSASIDHKLSFYETT